MLLLLVAILVAIPKQMNYQGKITDYEGVGLNTDIHIAFKLYPSLEGGVPLWTEIHPGVSIEKGLFSVILGSITPIDLTFDGQYYLEIVVDGDIMEPRQALTSEAYAFRALYADSIYGYSSNWILDDDVIYTSGLHGIARGGADNQRPG